MYRHLENNRELNGVIPYINYKKDNSYPIECDFSGTSLCYINKNKNELCSYPKENYDCEMCQENSSNINNHCKCNDGYSGIGCIRCIKGNYEDYNECKYINSLFNMEETYNCCLKSEIICTDGHIIKM